MIEHVNWTAAAVFIVSFSLVTVIGFFAGRWRAGDLTLLHEWGLGGRRFGTWVTWFLLGGDLYTAYTVIAIPSLVYAMGAYGFFAIPFTVIIYPLAYVILPRLWSVAHSRGHLTGADFIMGRYQNRWLELGVALTGIFATMPYIALQLIGMEKVIQALGFRGDGWLAHLPLTVAFIILAAYTYKSGLRAPAMIAVVKDLMIFIFVFAAIVILPMQLGGYGRIFEVAQADFAKRGGGAGLLLGPSQIGPFITLALGSAMAVFMYPQSITGVLAASSADAIKRNCMLLPAYSVVLGLIALLGFVAHAAGIQVENPQDVVPQLFLKQFPSWFAGFSFAAIAIGALVPAAIMSIGAANTFTRNVWKPLVRPHMSETEESLLAKLASLVVKVGALGVITMMPIRFATDLQLLGGVWMAQIFPAIVLGLYVKRINSWALLIGWALGIVVGTTLAWTPTAWSPTSSAAGWLPFTAYNGLITVVANVICVVLLSMIFPTQTRAEPA
jgi:SSS family solute:Na+ symporter